MLPWSFLLYCPDVLIFAISLSWDWSLLGLAGTQCNTHMCDLHNSRFLMSFPPILVKATEQLELLWHIHDRASEIPSFNLMYSIQEMLVEAWLSHPTICIFTSGPIRDGGVIQWEPRNATTIVSRRWTHSPRDTSPLTVWSYHRDAVYSVVKA